MVFKRRNRRSIWEQTREFVYPSGGFRRAVQYVSLRLSRLPDQPHRIARGIFAGVFASFTPFLGFHFLVAALLAWMIRGNILAAMLATFFGNPLTMPFIAIGSVEIGYKLLDIDAPLTFLSIVMAFTRAGTELWRNFTTLFTGNSPQWSNLAQFWDTIYFPYLVGGILPGLVAGLLAYWATIPIMNAYQKMRAGKQRDRTNRRRAERGEKGPRTDEPLAVGDDGQPPVG